MANNLAVASISMMRALNRYVELVFDTSRKDMPWEAEVEADPMKVVIYFIS